VSVSSLLTLLFCGKARLVATVHRTVAMSAFQGQQQSWDQIANKNTARMGGAFIGFTLQKC